jgi:hypothetical protein
VAETLHSKEMTTYELLRKLIKRATDEEAELCGKGLKQHYIKEITFTASLAYGLFLLTRGYYENDNVITESIELFKEIFRSNTNSTIQKTVCLSHCIQYIALV